MTKRASILISCMTFLAVFQLHTHNECCKDRPASIEYNVPAIVLKKSLPAFELPPGHTFLLTAPDPTEAGASASWKQNTRPVGGKYDAPLFRGLIQGTADLLGKDIDLRIATFRPDKLMLKVPISESLNLWWMGHIPGAYRSESRFGFSYSNSFTFGYFERPMDMQQFNFD